MIIRAEKLSRVLDTLTSDSHELKNLAANAGYDILTFFQGADLSELDLSNQDLTGMNFDNADLRFSNLAKSRFDAGAFNRAEISDDQSWLIDHYDLTRRDILEHRDDQIFIFVQFRPGHIDAILRSFDMAYSTFSGICGVSENALRKARKGVTVAFSTAKLIVQGLADVDRKLVSEGVIWSDHSDLRSLMVQPFAVFMSGGINGVFKPISQRKMHELISYKHYVDSLRLEYRSDHQAYRETPESLATAKGYFGTEPA